MRPNFDTAKLHTDDGKWHDGAEAHLGHCPECGKSDISYGEAKIEHSFIAYPGTCNDCGRNFEELHSTPFSHIEWDDD